MKRLGPRPLTAGMRALVYSLEVFVCFSDETEDFVPPWRGHCLLPEHLGERRWRP